MTPMISVIFPAYNCEQYVEAALTSILAQKPALEIIAVDDGSTDQTGILLDTFAQKDARVRVFHKKNGGVADARNYAISRAKGTWLAFCDSDDTLPAGAYECLLRRGDRADVVVGDFRDASDTAGIIKRRSDQARGLTPFQTLFLVPCLWTKLIRREYVLEHHLAFQPMKVGEDVVFLAELAALFPQIAFIPDCVYYHWSHDLNARSSLTHQYDPGLFQIHLDCRKKLLEISENAGIKEARRYVYHEMTDFLVNFLFCMEPGQGRQQAFQEFRHFMLQYNWSVEPGACLGKLGVTEQELESIEAEQYFDRVRQMLPRDRVLLQFQAGQIGFRYILKYIKAWAECKLKNHATKN